MADTARERVIRVLTDLHLGGHAVSGERHRRRSRSRPTPLRHGRRPVHIRADHEESQWP
jgi:hypothetical protein